MMRENFGKQHFVITANIIAVLAIGVCFLTTCSPPKNPAAKITSVQGEVWRQVEETQSAVSPGVDLFEGDVITTGNDSSATVAFLKGGIINLHANSALVISKTSATATKLGAVLLQGSVNAVSKEKDVSFTIGLPFGFAEIGGFNNETEVNLSTIDGINVLIGAIEVVGKDGKRTRIDTGMDAKGRVIPSTVVAELAPLDIVLLAKSKQVKIRDKDDKNWRSASKRDPIKPGTAIRTMRAHGTRIEVGSHALVSLPAGSEIAVLEPTREANLDRARYQLAAGKAVFEATRADKRATLHEIHIGKQEITIEPGVAGANVEVQTDSNGKSEIVVRQGRAILANGTIVVPGKLLNISKDGEISTRPLANTGIALQSGKSAYIYYNTSIPAVKLNWANAAAKSPYEVQVATDRDFNNLVWHETLSQSEMVFDQLSSRRYFWRVRTENGWQQANFVIEKFHQTDCRNCKHRNVVDDTGEKTVVYYQRTLPLITLRWKAKTNATKYRLKVFAAEDLDKPIINELIEVKVHSFQIGRLPENRYFWSVQAVTDDGKEIAAQRVNTLNITYDNAVAELVIRNPSQNAVVTSKKVTTNGEVRIGSRLWIDGRQTNLDKKGRFKETLALDKGLNQIIYRTRDSKGIERFYMRRVRRR
ncbi:MAG: hypothetical protein JW841_17790 [Deltaproteobacteria bacterium]|nr:hypothetical protein [Deltaproteobacteria bacterium]